MRFNKLDLNLLVLLDALLMTRSVSKAAEQVYLSQPAASLALKRLRDYFDDELLVPAGRSFVLTPVATELVQPVREVLLQLKSITRSRPDFQPESSPRRVTIEASDYVITVLLADVIRRAADQAPHMQFDIRSLSPQSPDNLINGVCEFLITPDFAAVPGQPSQALFEDSFSCLVSRGHPAWRQGLDAKAYFAAGHVGVEWGGGRRVTFDTRIVEASKKSRRHDVIAPNFTLVPELLIGTERIATLPTRLAQRLTLHFPVDVLTCPIRIPKFTEQIHWHKYQERDPALVWLRGLIHEVAQHIGMKF
jgi:LysR family nod box-dependent transcriptional activator